MLKINYTSYFLQSCLIMMLCLGTLLLNCFKMQQPHLNEVMRVSGAFYRVHTLEDLFGLLPSPTPCMGSGVKPCGGEWF